MKCCALVPWATPNNFLMFCLVLYWQKTITFMSGWPAACSTYNTLRNYIQSSLIMTCCPIYCYWITVAITKYLSILWTWDKTSPLNVSPKLWNKLPTGGIRRRWIEGRKLYPIFYFVEYIWRVHALSFLFVLFNGCHVAPTLCFSEVLLTANAFFLSDVVFLSTLTFPGDFLKYIIWQ